MAKKPEAETKDEAGAPKKGGGMLGLVVVAVASLVSSLGLFYFLSPAPAPPPSACLPGEGGPSAPVIGPLAEGHVYVEMKEILISIGSAPTDRYLKINLSIITEKANEAKVKSAEPMLMDAFNNYLRSVEVSDLEDPGFYPHLREQLSRRSELVVGSALSNGVLIAEFLLR